MADDPQEDIYFLKNQIDELNSKISSLMNECKKTEFKANRDIKQAQLAEQHAKGMLKKQKSESEALNKKLFDQKEAYKLLQKKMEKALEDKATADREKEGVAAMYTDFKNKFRRIQRLLPGEAMVQGLGMTLETIASYEDLYYSLQDKTNQNKSLEQQLGTAKASLEQLTKQKDSIIAEIKEKKSEIQKVLKESTSRLHEAESSLEKTRRELDLVTDSLEARENELQETKYKLEDHIHELAAQDRRVAELQQRLRIEAHVKEQEMAEAVKQQYEKYYHQLKNMEAKYEENQRNTVNNLIHIEETLNLKIDQLVKQTQDLQEAKATLEEQLQQQHRKTAQLESTKASMAQELTTISMAYEQQRNKYSSKLDLLEAERKQRIKEIQNLKNSLLEANKKWELAQASSSVQLQSLTQSVAEYKQKTDKLSSQLNDVEQQRDELMEEITMLKSEIQDLSGMLQNKSGSSSLSTMVEQVNRKRQDSEASNRLRSKSRFTSQSLEHEQKLNTERTKNAQLNQRIAELNVEVRVEKEKQKQAEEAHQATIKLTKDQLEGFAKRVDQLIKIEETQKYIIKKLNDDLLEEKNNLLKIKTSAEKYEKESQNRKHDDEQKQAKLAKIIQHRDKLLADQNKLFSDLKKQQEQKLASQLKNKELETKLASQERANQELQTATKLKIQQQAKEIDRLQSLVNSSHDKEKLAQQSVKRYKQEVQECEHKISEASKNQMRLKDRITELEEQTKDMKQSQSKSQKMMEQLKGTITQLKEQIQDLKKQVDQQRRNKTPFMRVPSLKAIDLQSTDQEMDNTSYLELSEKENELYFMKLKVKELEEEVSRLSTTHEQMKKHMEEECSGYIQEIIRMKMKVAETEMAAEQKMHHYHLMKKKYQAIVATKAK